MGVFLQRWEWPLQSTFRPENMTLTYSFQAGANWCWYVGPKPGRQNNRTMVYVTQEPVSCSTSATKLHGTRALVGLPPGHRRARNARPRGARGWVPWHCMPGCRIPQVCADERGAKPIQEVHACALTHPFHLSRSGFTILGQSLKIISTHPFSPGPRGCCLMPQFACPVWRPSCASGHPAATAAFCFSS